MGISIALEVAKAPRPPTRPTPTSPKGLASKEARRDQARFHRQVLAKDGNKCSACGRRREELAGVYPDLQQLIADHILPLSLGGSNNPSNGQTLCFFDNLKFGWRARYKTRKSDEPQQQEGEQRSYENP
jgi:5-methylcytosine-specific restriction endonuclease McrA